MELRARTRQQMRRAAMMAALGALIVPASAGAATHTPVITKVTPKNVSVGETLTLSGKYFRRGKAKNTVLFKRDGGKALFVKAGLSTTKQLTVVVPSTLEKYLAVRDGTPVATRFRLRVLTSRLSKAFTSTSASPVIGPAKPAAPKPPTGSGAGTGSGATGVQPDGDCDGDGVLNGADGDDDNDLLTDAQELALKLDPCKADTDGDGVEDGYEYKSAADLNNDDYQDLNHVVPYPGKRPYPNPLYAGDAGTDFDGDGLSLAQEQELWKYTYANGTAARTLTPLSYSDGEQYSLSALQGGDGRRVPTMRVSDYQPAQGFWNWAVSAGYSHVMLHDVDVAHAENLFNLLDFDRSAPNDTGSAGVSTTRGGSYRNSELYYWDLDNDGWVSDDERDEDSDGLTNYDETIGRMVSDWWTSCYKKEKPYPVQFAGTNLVDADSDGDGVRDGADDQDHDNVPNVMELSRNAATGRALPAAMSCIDQGTLVDPNPAFGWVNPYNACLPDIESRTCERHPGLTGLYPPFDPAAPDFMVLN